MALRAACVTPQSQNEKGIPHRCACISGHSFQAMQNVALLVFSPRPIAWCGDPLPTRPGSFRLTTLALTSSSAGGAHDTRIKDPLRRRWVRSTPYVTSVTRSSPPTAASLIHSPASAGRIGHRPGQFDVVGTGLQPIVYMSTMGCFTGAGCRTRCK